jgi:hypothetical protein
MIETPQVLQLSGKADFKSKESAFRADFLLTLYPARIDISIQTGVANPSLKIDDFMALGGVLADSRPISCERMIEYRSRIQTVFGIGSTASLRFTPLDEVRIGRPPLATGHLR